MVIIISLLLLAVAGLWLVVVQPVLTGRGVTPGVTVEPERLKAHVRYISEDCFPRHAGHVENLERVAAYIRSEFEQAGGRVSEQIFEVDGQTYRNVIAAFGPGTGPRLIVGAHYDAAGFSPGADDNASAVAGLIELAYLLGQGDPPGDVELVAYTLEEPPYFATPHMGSVVHAKSLKAQGVEVKLVIVLEMIGYFSDEKGSQHFPSPLLRLFYPSTGNFLALAGKLDQRAAVRALKAAMRGVTPLPVYSINAPAFVPGIDLSDHRSYWAEGYQAVMVTDTAFYRNLNYHTDQDTYDKLDYERMALVVKMVYAGVISLDGTGRS